MYCTLSEVVHIRGLCLSLNTLGSGEELHDNAAEGCGLSPWQQAHAQGKTE